MASGTRGYSSYRGRGRKGKIFLAILLILIILGSVGFIMAREHMRYDADGNLHFDLPWDKGTSDPVEAPGDPDVVIREPEQTAVKTPVRGTLLAGMPQSMSRVAHCIDNGPMEGFWGILKQERYYGRRFTSKRELVQMIETYIHYYNTRRVQRKLGVLTPME